jgi:hypothetical protein
MFFLHFGCNGVVNILLRQRPTKGWKPQFVKPLKNAAFAARRNASFRLSRGVKYQLVTGFQAPVLPQGGWQRDLTLTGDGGLHFLKHERRPYIFQTPYNSRM